MHTRPSNPRPLALLACVAVALLTGCQDMFPDVSHPGPAGYQRRRAELADPYPEPDTGPEMVGARPRDFNKPVAEVERARRVDSRFARPTVVAPQQPLY